jgi:hypothetical protein
MPARASARLAHQLNGLAIAVPQVVSHRMARLLLAGPNLSERDRREFVRMGTEKAEAFFDAWNAMAAQMLDAQLRLALLPFTWISMPTSAHARRLLATHGQRTLTATLSSGLAPLHRRATANARRLRKSK